MRNLIELTDSEITEKFSELDEWLDVDVDDLVFTRDTIEGFAEAAKNYNEYNSMEKTEKSLIVMRAQPKKGDQRKDVYIIDFGEVRACYS